VILRGLGSAITIDEQVPGWTPATIDVFSDWGSVFHVLVGAATTYVPPEFRNGLLALFAGYEASKSANGESWERIAGVWVEVGIGILGALALKAGGLLK